ncbi:N-acetylglucosamine-6-phosphate deacetylase [Microvirga brassicacearum]|uniref:N-acetylglucosamine-6-phosphate deacetylase n=1 Tax=Microvirga brassicacearum TaxID=2580413 RepID=A0A5N3PC32_9HYPH|nr:N-acetylglucosamine-6-phosphate deacetylase [Microvirga brassicacearum]KAB0267326.1 N-acetylglucosamine-6-phosphate deacetylase [Microvirga brassicacearum]
MVVALTGARIFDGTHILEGRAVILDGARIVGVPLEKDLGAGLKRQPIEGLLAPGFIDTQVNGGGGVLFNDVRTIDGIRTIASAHRAYGTTGLLPTFITDTRERMIEALEAMQDALAARVPGILGIHVEGPFINPERKGVHNPAYMRPMEDEDIAILTSLQQGRTIVTLAPEKNDMAAIARLAASGVLVCAGHTASDYATILEACSHGLRGFTHLYNAMPPLAGREPAVVGAALDSNSTWCGVIVDGHHVSDASLRIAIAAKGKERIMLVTDAMSVTGTDLTKFELHGRTIYRRDGKLTTEDGTLAGSDLDMAAAVRNAVNRLGVAVPDALRMASLYPASFLKLDHELGRIAPNYRASLVLLNDDLTVQRTWIDGAEN